MFWTTTVRWGKAHNGPVQMSGQTTVDIDKQIWIHGQIEFGYMDRKIYLDTWTWIHGQIDLDTWIDLDKWIDRSGDVDI